MTAKRRNFIVLFTILMLIATVLIQVLGTQGHASMGALPLQGSPPSSGEPLFIIENESNARYLRSAIGVKYDGSKWYLQKIAGQYRHINESEDDTERLPICTTSPSRGYESFNRDVLNQAPTMYVPRYLQLPGNTSERLRDLSHRITEGMPTPFEKAKAIETFLRVKYEYDLEYSPAPSGHEPNDWFLFEEKRGVCTHFNSAFVLLARASGIPARLATGYYVNSEPGKQVVYDNQAHAWAEVGLEGIGWIAFEAVPR
ncbi:MAG: transglutaminase-like domain-containing protein [Dehalococcoidia bacterium]